MEIKNISQKIFRSTPNKIKNCNNQTNPFGMNFKGNMITADVFDTSDKSKISFKGAELVARAKNKSKLLSSAIIGSINDVNIFIKNRVDSVMNIGRRIRAKSVEAWNYLNETKLVLNIGKSDTSLRLKRSNFSYYNIKALKELEPEILEDMFQRAIATKG